MPPANSHTLAILPGTPVPQAARHGPTGSVATNLKLISSLLSFYDSHRFSLPSRSGEQ
ncbi:MAG: hypothetical protein SFX18_09975 [Pirellulales bacterium]|nr:hypothetical protein [Pirellulales bacterium]